MRPLSLPEWDSFPNELRFAALRFAVTRLCEFFDGEDDEKARINDDFREYLERLRVLRREKEGGMEGLLMAMATGYDYRKYQKIETRQVVLSCTTKIVSDRELLNFRARVTANHSN